MKKFLMFLGLGILGGLVIAHICVQGYFISWETLDDPPEQPKEILSINKGVWIKSMAEKIYNHPTDEMYPFQPIDCAKKCWKEFEQAPLDEEHLYPVKDCRSYVPSTKKFITSKAVCHNFGPANILIVYGIDQDGNISFWQHDIGDTDVWAYFSFPIHGGVYVIVCYAAWIFIDDMRNRIKEWWWPKMPEDYPDN